MGTTDTYADLLGAIRLDPWGPDAACIGKADVLEDPDREDEAKALCLGNPSRGIPKCPVIAECTNWVMPFRRNDPGGVRAGMNEKERTSARRRRRAATPKPVTVIAKQCTGCGDTKSAGEFNRNRSRPDGLAAECRACTNARRQAANRDERAVG